MSERATTQPGVPTPEALQAGIEVGYRERDELRRAVAELRGQLEAERAWRIDLVGPEGRTGRVGELERSRCDQGKRLGAVEQVASKALTQHDTDWRIVKKAGLAVFTITVALALDALRRLFLGAS